MRTMPDEFESRSQVTSANVTAVLFTVKVTTTYRSLDFGEGGFGDFDLLRVKTENEG